MVVPKFFLLCILHKTQHTEGGLSGEQITRVLRGGALPKAVEFSLDFTQFLPVQILTTKERDREVFRSSYQPRAKACQSGKQEEARPGSRRMLRCLGTDEGCVKLCKATAWVMGADCGRRSVSRHTHLLDSKWKTGNLLRTEMQPVGFHVRPPRVPPYPTFFLLRRFT